MQAPQVVNTNTMSLEALKAFQYDQIRKANKLQADIQAVENEINRREVAEAMVKKELKDGATPKQVALPVEKPSINEKLPKKKSK